MEFSWWYPSLVHRTISGQLAPLLECDIRSVEGKGWTHCICHLVWIKPNIYYCCMISISAELEVTILKRINTSNIYTVDV